MPPWGERGCAGVLAPPQEPAHRQQGDQHEHGRHLNRQEAIQVDPAQMTVALGVYRLGAKEVGHIRPAPPPDGAG